MSRSAARFAILFALLFLAACRGNSPPAVTGATGDRLLYTRNDGLWILHLGTEQTQQVVSPPDQGQVLAARWSPDGTQIVYSLYEVRDRVNPVAEIYVAAADGTNPRKLLAAPQGNMFFLAPVWGSSNEELYFMFTGTVDGKRLNQIERIHLGTEERTVVLSEIGNYDVSRDGRWLTWVRSNGVEFTLILRNLQTSEQRTLAGPRGFNGMSAPRFDPSARTVLFSAGATGERLSQGSRPAPWTLATWLRGPVAWAHGFPQDLWTVTVPDGSPELRLAMHADEPTASWSPDGRQIAVLSSEALVVGPLIGPTRPLLTPGGLGTVDWSP